MNHTLRHTNNLVTCAACSYRAVLTTRGLIVTVDDPDHVSEDAQRQAAEYVEQLRMGLLRRAVGWDVRKINSLVRAIESEHGI